MTDIAISRLHFPVTTLGPGRRVGIWTQGCSIRCSGCISADTWVASRGVTCVDNVMSAITPWLDVSDGVTISGGEPFDQPEALKQLLRRIRSVTAVDILVFSGHPIEAISEHLLKMNGLVDAIISDPYVQDQAQTLALRGSDNQRLTLLTDLGAQRFSQFERPASPDDNKLDLMTGDDGEFWMAGIPRRDDFRRLEQLLAAKHHKVFTTQDRSSDRMRQHD